MYSILIAAAAALLVILVWGLVPIWGGWGLGIFLGFLVFAVTWIWFARRLRRVIEPSFLQAQKLAESGRVEQAVDVLESMLPLGKWMPMLTGQLHAQIGIFAHHLGDKEKALEHLTKASKRASEGQLLLATIHYKDGRFDATKRVLDKAIPYNRRNVLLYHAYAWILHKEGDTPGAMAVLQRHLAKEKDDETSKSNLLRLQNGNKPNMGVFGMQWYALGFERPPQSMGQLQQARKGFRQPPKTPGKRQDKKRKGKGRR
ncbi:MAG: hypothetical protein H6832_02270 [Planctomycetes bacterium]|nr:hypothetical protein [Planctomycetota bacterium]MCB9917215.1 hypothetical protein [Planctomycetota bacterium]